MNACFRFSEYSTLNSSSETRKLLNYNDDLFKIAEVKPIFNTGEKDLPGNYRPILGPIPLVSNLFKIYEKLLHKRLTNFINKHSIFCKFQYGFRKKLGTKNAFATITDIIYKKLDSSTPNAAVFLDLAKAFDTVDHEILTKK